MVVMLRRVPRPFDLGRALLLVLAAAPLFVAVPALTVAPTAASDRDTLTHRGPYRTETADVMVPRPDGGSSFEARLHYPLPGSAADAGDEPAPVVSFGHGYQTSVELYAETLDHLASWGIVAVAPRSGGELFPSHQAFADDLRIALDWVVSEAAAGDEWPAGPVDPAARAVAGHSMGGGAAVLAAADDPAIRAVATLAAAETEPSAIEAASRLAVPSLFVAAGEDAITPVAEHQRPMFEATRSGRAQLRTIVGGGHCGFLDSETLLLRLVCGEAAIDRDEQLATTRAVLTAWLLHELTADEDLAGLAGPDGPDAWTTVETR
jgi:pimeloyl-ACP methyl ester carboxylesterase